MYFHSVGQYNNSSGRSTLGNFRPLSFIPKKEKKRKSSTSIMNQGRNRCMGNSVHLVQGSLWQRNLFRKRGEDSPGTRGQNIVVHTIALSVQYVAIIAAFLAWVYPWQLSPLTAAVTSPYRYRYPFNAYFYLRRCRVVEPLHSTVLYKTATVHHTSGESTMAFDVFTFFPRIDWTCLDFFPPLVVSRETCSAECNKAHCVSLSARLCT